MGGAPGIITPSGVYTVIPGAYGAFKPTPSAEVSPTERGALAILAVMERFEPKDPVEANSPGLVKKLLPVLGHRMARLIWGILKEPTLRGSPSSVIFVRVNAATQAKLELLAGATMVLKLEAYDYGVFGNQIWAKVEAGTTAGTKKYTIGYGLTTEVYDDVALEAFSLNHANGGGELAALTMEVNNNVTGGYVRVTNTTVARALVRSTDVLGGDPNTLTGPFPTLRGLITFTVDQDPAQDITFVVTGTKVADDTPIVQNVVIQNGNVTATSADAIKDVTSITLAVKGAATTVDVTSVDTEWAPSTIAYDGKVTATIDVGTGDAGSKVHFTGRDKGTGQLVTDSVAIADPAVTAVSTKDFTGPVSARLEIKGSATTLVLSGYAFDLDVDQYATIADVVNAIGVQSALGYTAKLLTGKTVKMNELDDLAATTALGAATAKAVADLWEAEQQLTRSSLVVPTRTADVAGPPDNLAKTNFGGGGEGGAATATDWENAAKALEGLNIDHVACPGLTDSAIHEKVLAHVKTMDGVNERQAWLGAAINETIAQLFARAIAFNHYDVSLAAQEIRINDKAGKPEWLDPSWLGLAYAAASVSLPYGYPLTERLLNIDAFRQATGWTPDEYGGQLIKAGVQILIDAGLGPKILRQVTTYFGDEAAGILTAPSRVGSSNRCMKRIREVLRRFVGKPGFNGNEKTIERRAGLELQRTVADKEIYGFAGDTVVVGPITSGYNTEFDFTPVRSTEFMTFTGNLTEG